MLASSALAQATHRKGAALQELSQEVRKILPARLVILMLLRVHVLQMMGECARQAMKDMPVATGLMHLLVTPVMWVRIRLVPETVEKWVVVLLTPLCVSPAAPATSALALAR